MLAESSDDVFLIGIKVTSDDLPAPLNFVNDYNDIFRSVALAGSPTLTIASGLATFSIAQPLANAGQRVTFTRAGESETAFFSESLDGDPAGSLRIVASLDDATPPADISGAAITRIDDDLLAFPFSVQLPDETEQANQVVSLQIDNVNRLITESLRQLTQPPSLEMIVFREETPDTIEAGPFFFLMKHYVYDPLVVTCDLTYENIVTLSYPKDARTPAAYPGLF